MSIQCTFLSISSSLHFIFNADLPPFLAEQRENVKFKSSCTTVEHCSLQTNLHQLWQFGQGEGREGEGGKKTELMSAPKYLRSKNILVHGVQCACACSRMYIPNNGHIGTSYFVHCREVVLSLEIKNTRKCPLYGGYLKCFFIWCPLSEVPLYMHVHVHYCRPVTEVEVGPSVPHIVTPSTLTLELRPLTSSTWRYVQSLSQNPRLRLIPLYPLSLSPSHIHVVYIVY